MLEKQTDNSAEVLDAAALAVAAGRFADARAMLAGHVALMPQDLSAMRLLAETCFRMGLRDAGFEAALRAVDLAPSDIAYGLDCAYNLVRTGRRSDALALARQIATQASSDPYLCDTLGTIFTHCEAPEEAITHFTAACELAPNEPALLFNLASAQRMLGLKQEAEDSLDKLIALDPTDATAWLARSAIRRQTPENNHVAPLQEILSSAESTPAAIPIGYALAKELEDLGRHPESFAALNRASRAQRAAMHYEEVSEIALMGAMRSVNYASIEATEAPLAPPIFIVGLPRSGTTLVERIVTSHPGVQSAGETNGLSAEVWRVASLDGRPTDFVAAARQAIETNGATIGRNYIAAVRQRFPQAVFVDKTPGHYLFAGLIAAAIPGARIICLRRNPMDSCYAMYKTLFEGAYPFSYDLQELATYYAHWSELIAHWQASLGDAWLTVDYEDLIQQPELVMRRIVAHAGLPWGPEYARFHERTAPVTTASAGQVDRPLNADSIGLWRRYADELRPLRDRLEALGIATE
jgi:tetratricopeptide (TPR) repeat protein